MNARYLCKLAKSNIIHNKKLLVPFAIIIFLSTFLLTSVFTMKDSYDNYQLKLSEKIFGNWDIRTSSYELKNNKNISQNLETLLYESPLSLYYKNLESSFKEVSSFTNTLPISLYKGAYPAQSNEVLIEEPFAKSKHYKIGDTISFSDYTRNTKSYIVSGIFNKNTWFPTTFFYTKMPQSQYSNAMIVYTKIKNNTNKNFIQTLKNKKEYVINTDVLSAKNHNQEFDKLYALFSIFVFVCTFLFISSASSMYLKRKKEELHQLSILGATKKQLIFLVIINFFIMYSILFVMSFIVSLSIWYLSLTLSRTFLMQTLHLSIGLDYALSLNHLILLILMNVILFILGFLIALVKTRKTKQKKLHFRNIRLTYLPITWKLAILDILRTGYGSIIILMIMAVTVFFHTTQFVVESWITNSKSFLSYNTDVNINFDLFQKNGLQLHAIIKKIDTVCDAEPNACAYKYGIQAEAKIGTISTEDVYTVDTQTYETLQKQSKASPSEAILLTNKNEKTIFNNEVTLLVQNKWKELLDTITVKSVELQQQKLNTITYPESGYILILPKQMVANLMDTYPSTYISGSIYINGEYASALSINMKNSLKLDGDDQIYIQDNVEVMKQFERDIRAVRIFIYSFNFIAISICLFLIQNIVAQYYESRKHDIYLLRIAGMTKNKIRYQYINQIILYTFIALLPSFMIAFFICVTISSSMRFDITPLPNIFIYILYGIGFLCLMISISLTRLRFYIKK